MGFLFLFLGIFLMAYWLIKMSILALFGTTKEKEHEFPKSDIIINNYFHETHNHLYVDDGKLKSLKDE